MLRSVTLKADEERIIIGTKILAASAIGYLASKYITTIDPMSGALFSALATVIDIIATRFLKANKMNKAFISSFLSFASATWLTSYFAKFTVIQAVKITFYLTVSQLALATLGAGVLMGGFATLASILTNKLIEKV